MKKLVIIYTMLILALSLSFNQAQALINIDDESVKIAIKYGLDNKYSTSKELLGPNWVEGDNGVILTIFSPFIQLASKAKSQNVPGSSEEDIVLVKKRLGRQLNQITTRQEIRFIVQLVGNSPDFAKKYEAKIESYVDPEEAKEAEEAKNDGKKGKGFWIFKKQPKRVVKHTPTKYVKQTTADLDNYNPVHPYTAINSYSFSFEKINNLDKFYFILTGPKEEEIKFLIEKNVIF